jgi:hypothetical protein
VNRNGSQNFPQAMDGDATRSEKDGGDHTLNGKLIILLKTQGKSVVYLLPTFSSNTKRANNPPHFGSAGHGFSTELFTGAVD